MTELEPRQRTVAIFSQEQSLVVLMKRLDEFNDSTNGSWLLEGAFPNAPREPEFHTFFPKDLQLPYPSEWGTFSYQIDPNPFDISVKVGIGTGINLRVVRAHTEEFTQPLIDKFLKDYKPDINEWGDTRDLFLWTNYYFDGKGNHAKIISLPDGIDDNRQSLQDFFGKVHLVQSTMTEKDFSMAEETLKFFKKKIQGYIAGNHERQPIK